METNRGRCKESTNIWNAFSNQIEPQENFRIHRLSYNDTVKVKLSTLMTSCSDVEQKPIKCKFNNEAIIEERMIELLIAGVRHPEVQKILLSRDEKLTLEEALKITRTHEASAAHMSQLIPLSNQTLPRLTSPVKLHFHRGNVRSER